MAGLKSMCILLALLLVTVACNAKKLWGVDMGKKDEGSEFETLLEQASDQGGAADLSDMLSAFAEADLTKLSVSEIVTNGIDLVIELAQDEEWRAQTSEPGVIRQMLDNNGMEGMLEADGAASAQREDLVELLSLEGNPILYKAKFNELTEKIITYLINLRMELEDPEKLKKYARDLLKSAGLQDDVIDQVMVFMDMPELLAMQLKALLEDPAMQAELKKMMDSFTQTASALEKTKFDDAELERVMSELEKNPELMEEMYAELLRDPGMAEMMDSPGGLGDNMARKGGAGGPGIFSGLGGRRGAQRAEL